jgi:hypothetical protein
MACAASVAVTEPEPAGLNISQKMALGKAAVWDWVVVTMDVSIACVNGN